MDLALNNLQRLIGHKTQPTIDIWPNVCLPLPWETGQVIPKTQKMVLVPPCLTLSIIRYISRVKWSKPRKGIAPSPTPQCSSY